MEYSLEQLNYFRICHVAFNLVPVGLRQIFKQEWDFRYKITSLGEWKDTPQNGQDFYNNESRKSRKKNARYLATIQNGNTSEWDCSCLFFAILYSDSVGTTISPAVRAAIDDIRQVRNDIAHINEAKLTDAEFQTYVSRVSSAVIALGLPINEVDEVKNQTSFPTEEVENLKKEVLHLKSELDNTKQDLSRTKSDLDQKKNDLDLTKLRLEAAEKTLQNTQAELHSTKDENKALTQELNLKLESFCLLAFKPPHEVIRRASDIERVTNKMQELRKGADGVVSTIYLSGNPGCGKSQLALQLGREFFSRRSDNAEEMTFVATLNAENIETLADSYMTLGKRLGITEYSLSSLQTTKREKPGETIQQIQCLMLPQVRKYSKWLIVADNVVDLKSVRSLLPQTGSEEWGHGQVLVTTQDSSAVPLNAPHTYHESFSRGMQPADAVELLEKISQITGGKQTADVARALDYQPLALAAAAYYVQTVITNGSPDYNWTMYLKGLTKSQREATENVLANESLAYSKTTASAVKMAMERAVDTDEVLCQAFSFFAVCAAEALPLEAVVKFVKVRMTNQPEELIKAKILKSSLILVSADEEEQRLYLGIHNIVHAVLKQDEISKLKSEDRNQNIADAVKIFKTLLDLGTENRVLLSQLTIHCKSLLEHMTSHLTSSIKVFVKKATLFITVNEVVDWLGSFSEACTRLCDFSLAKSVVDLSCTLIDNISNFGEGALLKGKIFSRSGEVYGSIGKYNEAKKFHEKALTIRKNMLGEDHPEVATSYSNLGLVHDKMGEYDQAKEFHKKALVIDRKIFGDAHPNVAASYNNLGLVHNNMGEYNHAKEFHEKALMFYRKIFGDDHSSVATSYNNLGLVHNNMGEYKHAKEFHEKALMIGRKIFGDVHFHVATCYTNLGVVHDTIGEYNQAKTSHEKALMIYREIFGDDHPNVATSYNNLGLVHNNMGEYDHAKEFLEKAMMFYIKIFGDEHPLVATSYTNLGVVHDKMGEYNQAKKFHEKALMICRKIFGDDHPNVAKSYNNLGLVHINMGKYNHVKEFHEKALMIRRKIFGDDHPLVATSYNNLGGVHYTMAEYNQAKEFHEKALVIDRKIFGDDHPKVATSYNNLGLVHNKMGEYYQAKEFHEKALVILRKIFGDDHPYVATSYTNLGLVHDNMGEYNEAKEFHEKSLMIRREIFGDDHPHVATSYNNLGLVHDKMGEYYQAKEFHKKALMIYRKFFGNDHPHVATSYTNLGLVHNNMGEHFEAKEFLEKSLMIRRKIFGDDHPHVATSYSNLGLVHDMMGEYNQAKEFRDKGIDD